VSELLSTKKWGMAVRCNQCGHRKAPIGRSVPLGLHMCHASECEGYRQPPYPGSLWPGETEADFGYPVDDNGTNLTVSGDED